MYCATVDRCLRGRVRVHSSEYLAHQSASAAYLHSQQKHINMRIPVRVFVLLLIVSLVFVASAHSEL